MLNLAYPDCRGFSKEFLIGKECLPLILNWNWAQLLSEEDSQRVFTLPWHFHCSYQFWNLFNLSSRGNLSLLQLFPDSFGISYFFLIYVVEKFYILYWRWYVEKVWSLCKTYKKVNRGWVEGIFNMFKENIHKIDFNK